MAVFLLNNCKFTGCGLTFPTLGDLIQHIEETHIDSDPRVLERQELQQPTSLSLSYILRFFTEAARKENGDNKRKLVANRTQSPALSIRSVTPTGSEFDDEEMVSEDDSDDSWTTQEEFPTDFILRYSSVSVLSSKEADVDKPFACPVPGCKKRYKNVNGIKYHARNGHRKEAKVKKAFKCVCGKSYKTPQGLRNHSVSHHPATELLNLHTQHQAVPISKPIPVKPSLIKKPASPNCLSTALSKVIPAQAILTIGGGSLTSALTPVTLSTTSTPSVSIPAKTINKSQLMKPALITASSKLTQLAETSALVKSPAAALINSEQS